MEDGEEQGEVMMEARRNRIGSILRRVGRRQVATGDEGKSVERRPRSSRDEPNPGKRFRNGNRRVVESEVLAKAVSLAHQYAASDLPLNGVISKGLLDLVESAQRFAPQGETRLTGRAVWPLQRCLIKSVVKQRGVIGIPWHKLSPLYRIESTSGILREKNGSPVCLREEKNGEGRVKLKVFRTPYGKGIDDASLAAFISPDRSDGVVYTPVENNPFLNRAPKRSVNVVRMRVHAAIENLPDREQAVLTLHYGLNGGESMTFAEIGRIMKLSLQRVEHLENQAIDRLRKILEIAPEDTTRAEREPGKENSRWSG